MPFPETRLTLIRRLSDCGSDLDWRDFLDDYWPPLCAFAMRWGGLSLADAEDVAGETLQAIVKNRLLARWQIHRAARLRTLLCSVARNVISNRARVERGRNRILRGLAQAPASDLPPSIWKSDEPSEEQEDVFYRAWLDDLLDRCVQSLLADLHHRGKGDYFRVLYGRLCDGLSVSEVAQVLQIPTTTAENYYKAARKRLATELQRAVRQHVEKYCGEGAEDDEFRDEWSRLSAYLQEHGGIENAVRSCHRRMTATERPSRDSKTREDTAAILIAATGDSVAGQAVSPAVLVHTDPLRQQHDEGQAADRSQQVPNARVGESVQQSARQARAWSDRPRPTEQVHEPDAEHVQRD